MKNLNTVNVGHVVKGILAEDVDFTPGPMVPCSRRLAVYVMGRGPVNPQGSEGVLSWPERRFKEVEAQHQANISVQVHAFIRRRLWRRWTDRGVSMLTRALHVWCNALAASYAMTRNCVPAVEVRALYAVKVAAYLDAHEDLATPTTITVKLMEVPKPGQPGLMTGGAALITEKKLIVEGQYNPLQASADGAALQQ